MTEEAQAAVAVEAPAAPETPVEAAPGTAVAAPVEAPARPTPVREAMDPHTLRQQVVERARESVSEAAGETSAEAAPAADPVQDRGDGRDAKGQFVASPDAATPAAEVSPLGADPKAPAAPAADAPVLPEGFVRLNIREINPDSPVLARTEHLDVPAADEDYHRMQLKNPVRKAQVEDIRRASAREIAKLQARLDALSSPESRALDTPETQQIYDQLKEGFGEDAAENYKRGIEAQRDALVSERTESELAKADAHANAQAFMENVGDVAPKRYGVWANDGSLEPRLTSALGQYAAAVDAGRADGTLQDFYRQFDRVYLQDPRVDQMVQEHRSKQDGDRIASLVETEVTKRMDALTEQSAEARARHDTNPMRRIPTAVAGSRPPASEAVPADDTSVTAGDLRRNIRRQMVAGAASTGR